MSALARMIGVSPSMVSQIERGQSLPSVETLFALAGALGATVDTFFEAEGQSSAASRTVEARGSGEPLPAVRPLRASRDGSAGEHPYVVRKSERLAINIQGGVRWERLTPQALDGMEFLELIYEPGAQSSEHLYPHPGFELVMVIEGRFEIHVGFERYVLDPGDSIAFASSLPHRYVNPLQTQSRAVTTILHEPGAVRSTAPTVAGSDR